MNRAKTILQSVPKPAVVAFAAVAALTPMAVSAWGPARDIYCIKGSPIACPVSNPAGEVANKVTFNSIANNPAHGDERNFMQIKEAGVSNSTYADSITLQPGKTYEVFMYYHNNASSSLNATGKGIAHGVNVRSAIPALVGPTDTKAVGYIKSTESGEVWDDIVLRSANDGQIALRLVPGSAKLYNHNDGQGNATKVTTLSNDIVTAKGAAIGYTLNPDGTVKLDGVIPGCNEYAGYITYQLVADQANFTVGNQVRINNDGAAINNVGWSESVNAQPGDIVDFMIQYKNTGTTQQNDVVIKNKLPANLSYIAGSARFYNVAYPLSAGGHPATDDVTGVGLNLGNYKPGADAVVTFKARVADKDALPCGKNTLTNVGRVETNNGAKEDPLAIVVVGNDCTAPVEKCDVEGKTDLDKSDPNCKEDSKITECKPGIEEGDPRCYELPKTGATSVVTGVIGAASLATAGAYFIRSRKNN